MSFKKGDIPWNTGKTFSEESKKKMSKSHMGKEPWNKGLSNYLSDESREKISKANIGHIPWNKGLSKKTDERVKKYGKSKTENTIKKKEI